MRAEKVLSSLSVLDVMSFLDIPADKFEKLSLEEGEWYANSGLYRLLGSPSHLENETLVLGGDPMYVITETGRLVHKILSE